jgi:hypothetical protein
VEEVAGMKDALVGVNVCVVGPVFVHVVFVGVVVVVVLVVLGIVVAVGVVFVAGGVGVVPVVEVVSYSVQSYYYWDLHFGCLDPLEVGCSWLTLSFLFFPLARLQIFSVFLLPSLHFSCEVIYQYGEEKKSVKFRKISHQEMCQNLTN